MASCPDCGSKVIQQSQEKICSKCGLVLGEDYYCGQMLLL